MTEAGYYRYATIQGANVVFACEDDLWSVPVEGGLARKLTSVHGETSMPKLSPDGKNIAFVSRDEGHPEVWVVPAVGGLPRRLTFIGGDTCHICCWSNDSREIIFASDARSPFSQRTEGFIIGLDGGVPRPLNLGHMVSLAISKRSGTLLGMNSLDPARWKRYRGGRAGEIWIDPKNNGTYKRLVELKANVVSPMFVNDEIFFLADHEGVGNLYSCRPDGSGLKRRTSHDEYYVRYPSTDGRNIVYTSGGDLYVFDPRTNKSRKIPVQVPSTSNQSVRKFIDARRNLEHFSPHPDGHSVSLIARGQPLTLANWEGAVMQHGKGSRSRYRRCEWLPDGKRFVVVSDANGFEQVELHYADQSHAPVAISNEDVGRVIDLRVSPKEDVVALANHRQELLLLDLKTKKLKNLDKSPADRISGLAWSGDGRWIAYNWAERPQSFIIRVVDSRTGKVHNVTKELRLDCQPCFDPEGRYLYFLSSRDFYPVYDSVQFDLSFPSSMRPFLVTLRKDVESPFIPRVKDKRRDDSKDGKEVAEIAKPGAKQAALKKGAKVPVKPQEEVKNNKTVEIDFDGIEHRVLGFPVLEGRYGEICASKNRVFFTQFPVRGIRPHNHNMMSEGEETGAIVAYDFDEQRAAFFQRNAQQIRVSNDGTTLFTRFRERIRAVSCVGNFPNEGAEPPVVSDAATRKTGWLDLSRAHVLVQPKDEWRQMYGEAWRLQHEHFWDASMSEVDWKLVHDRYAALLPRIRTRSELSDVMWEMQGELGTSHAYEIGGDYRHSPNYHRGFLGADMSFDSKNGGYRIDSIIRGDSWDSEFDSPLAGPGLDIRVGDVIIAVGGRAATKDCSVDELLLNLHGKEVSLTVVRDGRRRNVVVKTLRTERLLRYRNWVESNRRFIHEKSKGKLGYVHIPDMGPQGFAEFHRAYLHEFHKDGLVVDVRFNRGGHVSPLLLEKLRRKRVGYDISRWGPPQPYPNESIAGPIVALTNQFAGSDGDIFSHCFKLYDLGPLVGKRTWGGVIGIWPRHRLVDGTVTTQPEFSFWFVDVGWSVENHGTDPDYDVDITPQDARAGRDPQLDKALQLALEALKKTPVVMPDFSKRPSLALPRAKRPISAKVGKSGATKKPVAPKRTAQAKGKTGRSKSAKSR